MDLKSSSQLKPMPEAGAPNNKLSPYPTQAYYADFEGLKGQEITKAHLQTYKIAGTLTTYTALFFETKSGEVIIARSGPEAAPEGRAAGKYMLPELVNKIYQSCTSLFGMAAKEIATPFNYGRCVSTMNILPEIKERATDTVMQTDGNSLVLGGWDVAAYKRGQGISGLKLNPRMELRALTEEPKQAQNLFNKTIETMEAINKIGPRYTNLPKKDSGKANSNTAIAMAVNEAGLWQKFTQLTGSKFSGLIGSIQLPNAAEMVGKAVTAGKSFFMQPSRPIKLADLKDLSRPSCDGAH